MGIDIYPPSQSVAGSTSVLTRSQIATTDPTNAADTVIGALSATNHKVQVPMVYGASLSGAMISVSGTYAGMNVAFEAATADSATIFRPWPAWHMQQGTWLLYDILPTNGSVAYWMPANGATNVRLRVTGITSGSANAHGIGMHAPANIGTGPIGKQDWVGVVSESIPGNNVQVMQNMFIAMSTFLGARGITIASSYTIPAGKRLRIHSYSGSFLANVALKRCIVSLRSNMAGATTTGSDLLGQWAFAPIAGGTNDEAQWSGLASTLKEPIDIYSPTGAASVGIGAQGGSGTSGKLTFNLFGYLVG